MRDAFSWLFNARGLAALTTVVLTLLAPATRAHPAPATAAPAQPNILVIWGDDVGMWNISGYHRGTMGGNTPNLDRISREGLTFMDHYGQASCTAGRAAFITGQYPIRTGLTTVGLPGSALGLQKQDPTIAELLKPHGYATGQFGKNHLGDRDEFLPTAHGFDEFYGFAYHLNAAEYANTYDYPKNPALRKQLGPQRGVLHAYANPDGTQRIEDTGPLSVERMRTIDSDITSRSVRFMQEQVRAGKPFFNWTNFTRMHIKTHLSPQYDNKTGFGLYADGMQELDDNVGKLLKSLDDLGIADNTIVIFSTDNGANVMDWPDGGNTPFRGEKGLVWEGGFRVPALVRWPGHVPANTTTGEFMTMEDWLPTLLSVAGEPDVKGRLLKGMKVGKSTYKVHLDGYDQTDLLTGKGPSKRKEFFYFSETSLQAMRYDRYKFVYSRQDKWFNGTKDKLNTPLIIDLKLDPFERMIDSRGYNEWLEDHAYLLSPASRLVTRFVVSLKEFPPRQRGTNFDVDEIVRSAVQSAG